MSLKVTRPSAAAGGEAARKSNPPARKDSTACILIYRSFQEIKEVITW
jgi:hypothetical protein